MAIPGCAGSAWGVARWSVNNKKPLSPKQERGFAFVLKSPLAAKPLPPPFCPAWSGRRRGVAPAVGSIALPESRLRGRCRPGRRTGSRCQVCPRRHGCSLLWPRLFNSRRDRHRPSLFNSRRDGHRPALFDSWRDRHRPALYDSWRDGHRPALYDSRRDRHRPALFESRRDDHWPALLDSRIVEAVLQDHARLGDAIPNERDPPAERPLAALVAPGDANK